MYVQIKDKDGLVRDMSSGAVLNTNQSEYENYLNRRNKAKLAKEQEVKQQEELNSLKNEISEIKQMLLALINKQLSE